MENRTPTFQSAYHSRNFDPMAQISDSSVWPQQRRHFLDRLAGWVSTDLSVQNPVWSRAQADIGQALAAKSYTVLSLT
jgi:hypothetical protein